MTVYGRLTPQVQGHKTGTNIVKSLKFRFRFFLGSSHKKSLIINKSLETHLLTDRHIWLGEKRHEKRGGWRAATVEKKRISEETETRGETEMREQHDGSLTRKLLWAQSKRWSSLFARMCVHCVPVYMFQPANAPLSQKNWMVQKSGWLIKSAPVSLLGHCLQTSTHQTWTHFTNSMHGCHTDEIRAL